MTKPRVAIIILNWNAYAHTAACLDSIQQISSPAYDVLLIDNGSVDGSAAHLRENYPEIAMLETRTNLGFVGGNNLGMDVAAGLGVDYFLLLNNDTEVKADFLDQMVRTLEANPSTAIVGPLIYYFDQPSTVWSAGGAIDWKNGSTRMLHLDEADRGQLGSEPYEVDFVTGCALLVRAPVVSQVGGMDPRFFAYFEETEWCVRVRNAGWKIQVVPTAQVWHKISKQAREASPQVHYYMTRNRLLFLKLTRAGWETQARTYLEFLRIYLSWTVRPRWRYKNSQRKAMLSAVLDHTLGKYGRVETHIRG